MNKSARPATSPPIDLANLPAPGLADSEPAWRTRAHAPAPGTRVCALADVPEDNGHEVTWGDHDPKFRLVIFRVADGVVAYINECPHFRIPTNYQPGVFCLYDIDDERQLMCAHHTAMFRLADGVCVDGPCIGAGLIGVPVEVRRGDVYLAE